MATISHLPVVVCHVPQLPGKAMLVIAGGYDARVQENVEHLEELRTAAGAAGLTDAVVFLTSVSDVQRAWLLLHAIALLYTPSFEHFGIVPVEVCARTSRVGAL